MKTTMRAYSPFIIARRNGVSTRASARHGVQRCLYWEQVYPGVTSADVLGGRRVPGSAGVVWKMICQSGKVVRFWISTRAKKVMPTD